MAISAQAVSNNSRIVNSAAILLLTAVWSMNVCDARSEVDFAQSAETVDAYDFMEVTVRVKEPNVRNPFTDVTVQGWFSRKGGPRVPVDGFCDSADGSIFRIRFMPTQPGDYTCVVKYRHDSHEASYNGRFTAKDSSRKGLVRVDKDYPWHFVWEGTGEHYFWNGTTTYFLMGWDDQTIQSSIERLHKLKVNRMRVAINGRVKNGRAWYENVYPTEKFSFLLNPWVAQQPDSVEKPGFDVTRFNVAYWRKWDRMLRFARDRDMVISVIFYVDGRRPGTDPFKKNMGKEDEQRYYRHAVARFAAFSNVMWDVTNEYRSFRNNAWAEKMGALLKKYDPYDHLTCVHGHGTFSFQKSAWADFAMYQRWDEHGGYQFMLNNRRQQEQTGRIIPQVNEEYGYESHYPRWGGNRKAPARSADNRRRLAWEIYMAGCYQTTGERAETEKGWKDKAGGGWLNGRGDDTMVMLKGYGHIVDFFTSIRWWQLQPDNGFFETPQKTSVGQKLTHIVYTRDNAGRATLYLDGHKQATATIKGSLSNWDASYRLALANEFTKDRAWLGELYRVAVYDRALGPQEVKRNFKAGRDKRPASPQVLYDFREARGDTIKDVSDRGKPLDLKIEKTTAVKWLRQGGLAIRSPVLIASPGPATKLTDAVRKSKVITIEAWIKPANTTQTGPARIVTLSKNTGSRNFTLGQKGGAYEVRLRTTSTSPNGEPALSSPDGDDTIRRVCGLRSKKGDLAVIYLASGGEARLKQGSLKKGLRPQWFNPRNGKRASAKGHDGTAFVAPDEQDWVLLFRQEP